MHNPRRVRGECCSGLGSRHVATSISCSVGRRGQGASGGDAQNLRNNAFEIGQERRVGRTLLEECQLRHVEHGSFPLPMRLLWV